MTNIHQQLSETLCVLKEAFAEALKTSSVQWLNADEIARIQKEIDNASYQLRKYRDLIEGRFVDREVVTMSPMGGWCALDVREALAKMLEDDPQRSQWPVVVQEIDSGYTFGRKVIDVFLPANEVEKVIWITLGPREGP